MKKGTLLIVDDEPHLIKVLEFTLRNVAENILSAENGKDALRIIADRKIDCVLCDVNLPRMSGIEVLREVRARKQKVPFIFFSAEGGVDALEAAAKLGAVDFFFKPHFTGLEKAIASILQPGSHRPVPDSEFGKTLVRLGLDGK